MKIWKEYVGEIEKLGNKFLELIFLSLGLAGDQLNELFQWQTSLIHSIITIHRSYDRSSLVVGRYKDVEALTVLFQDGVKGLEVKGKVDGEWIGLKPIPNAYIINVGDIILV